MKVTATTLPRRSPSDRRPPSVVVSVNSGAGADLRESAAFLRLVGITRGRPEEQHEGSHRGNVGGQLAISDDHGEGPPCGFQLPRTFLPLDFQFPIQLVFPYAFSSFFSSLRSRQSVPWAMIFCGLDLTMPALVEGGEPRSVPCLLGLVLAPLARTDVSAAPAGRSRSWLTTPLATRSRAARVWL